MKGIKTGGRKAGTPNKATKSANEAVKLAFEGLEGVKGLIEWAKKNDENRGAFYRLYARLIHAIVDGGEESEYEFEIGQPRKVEIEIVHNGSVPASMLVDIITPEQRQKIEERMPGAFRNEDGKDSS